MTTPLRQLLAQYRAAARTEREKGTYFERLALAFIKHDPGMRAHTADSHHSASFAFKRARHSLDLKATYRPEGSRASLMQDAAFKAEFDRQRQQIGLMHLRYVEIECPIEQHLFELYAAMRLGTSLSEFTTS